MKNIIYLLAIALFIGCMDKSETDDGSEQFEFSVASLKTEGSEKYFKVLGILGLPEQRLRAMSMPVVKRTIIFDSAAYKSVNGDMNKYFLEKVPDSSIVEFRIRVAYNSTVLLKRRKNLILKGNNGQYGIYATTNGETSPTPINDSGDIREFWPSKRSQLAVRGGENIVFDGLYIRGSNNAWDSIFGGLKDSVVDRSLQGKIPMGAYVSKYEKQHGIDVEGAKKVQVINCNIQRIWGDGIYMGRWSDFNGDWTDTALISKNYIRFNGRQVVAIVGSRNTDVVDNYFDWHRRATVDLEPDDATSGCENINVLRNIVGPGQLLFIASGGAPALIKNVRIEDNVAVMRALNMTIGPSDSLRVTDESKYLRVNWTLKRNISDTTQTFNSQGASGFMNIWFGKDFQIEGNVASVTTTTAATMWFFSCGIDTVSLKTKNRFSPTPYKWFVYPTEPRSRFVCDGSAPPPVDTVVVPPPPIDTPKPPPPVDTVAIIQELRSITITSPIVQSYKITTSTGATTLKTGTLSIGENRIELTAYFKKYKTLRVYIGTKYYTVTKP